MYLCIFAELAAEEVAPTLPRHLDEFQTLDMVFANGRTIVFNIVWQKTKADMDRMLATNGPTLDAMNKGLDTNGRKILCELDGISNIIEMGAIMQINYRTEDWHPFHSVRVSTCR